MLYTIIFCLFRGLCLQRSTIPSRTKMARWLWLQLCLWWWYDRKIHMYSKVQHKYFYIPWILLYLCSLAMLLIHVPILPNVWNNCVWNLINFYTYKWIIFVWFIFSIVIKLPDNLIWMSMDFLTKSSINFLFYFDRWFHIPIGCSEFLKQSITGLHPETISLKTSSLVFQLRSWEIDIHYQ